MGNGRDLETVRRTREAVGPGPRIRVDANEALGCGHRPADERRIGAPGYRLHRAADRCARPAGAARAEVRRTTRVPVAANQGIWSLAEAGQAIRLEAGDVIVTGALWLGGLLPLQRVGGLCAETGVGLCLHAPPMTSIATAAGHRGSRHRSDPARGQPDLSLSPVRDLPTRAWAIAMRPGSRSPTEGPASGSGLTRARVRGHGEALRTERQLHPEHLMARPVFFFEREPHTPSGQASARGRCPISRWASSISSGCRLTNRSSARDKCRRIARRARSGSFASMASRDRAVLLVQLREIAGALTSRPAPIRILLRGMM